MHILLHEAVEEAREATDRQRAEEAPRASREIEDVWSLEDVGPWPQ